MQFLNSSIPVIVIIYFKFQNATPKMKSNRKTPFAAENADIVFYTRKDAESVSFKLYRKQKFIFELSVMVYDAR